VRLSIATEPFDSPDAQRLVDALDEGYAELKLYKPSQMFGRNLRREHTELGRGTFVVARLDGKAVGCGAIRLLSDGDAEVKRMYVDPSVRRQGIGKTLLARLEAAARELGARRLVLETGIYQLAAIELYRANGFTPVDCWSEYAGSSTSLCLEKHLEN
jgi:putative acetyltransferase